MWALDDQSVHTFLMACKSTHCRKIKPAFKVIADKYGMNTVCVEIGSHPTHQKPSNN